MAFDHIRDIMRSLLRDLPGKSLSPQSEIQIRILSEVSRAVGSSLEGPDVAHQLITEAVTSLLSVERSILFLPDGEFMHAVAASGIVDSDRLEKMRIPEGQGAVGRVMATGESVYVRDTANPPFPLSDLVEELHVRAIVAAPLKLQNNVIGVIAADTKRDGEQFTEEDLQVLEVFGTFAALVTSEANLIEELREQNAYMTSLFDLARELNSEASPAAVLRTALDSAVEQTGSVSGSLIFVDPQQQELVIRAAEGLPEDVDKTLRLSIGQGVTGWVAREGRSARIDDVRTDERYVEARGNVRSELAVPIRTGKDIVGVLNVDSDRTDAFTEQHQNFLEALADLAAARIRLAFLEDQQSEDA